MTKENDVESLEMRIMTDVNEIVELSQGTKWDLQDPKYAALYVKQLGGIPFIFIDGVAEYGYNGQHWFDRRDHTVQLPKQFTPTTGGETDVDRIAGDMDDEPEPTEGWEKGGFFFDGQRDKG